jgi:hypothetical protein
MQRQLVWVVFTLYPSSTGPCNQCCGGAPFPLPCSSASSHMITRKVTLTTVSLS